MIRLSPCPKQLDCRNAVAPALRRSPWLFSDAQLKMLEMAPISSTRSSPVRCASYEACINRLQWFSGLSRKLV